MGAKQFQSDADIARVCGKFLDRTLSKPEWTHAAHFAVTLFLLRHQPERDLEREMAGLIRAFNDATGTPNTDTSGYHQTITLASLKAARAQLHAGGDKPLHAILDALLASPLGDSKWLLKHWSRERLFSVEARRGWLAPDLKPLPWA